MWRSRVKVFLDVCCIDQVNVTNKQKGIMSLGGILNSCKTLLILWDETYIERLWCVSLGCLSRLHISSFPSQGSNYNRSADPDQIFFLNVLMWE